MEHLMIYSVPLLFADQLRLGRSDRSMVAGGARPWGNYLLIGAISAFSGYVAELLWLVLSQGLTVGKFQLALPWTLLSGGTAFFYVWNLDTVEVHGRFHAGRHVALQAAIFAVLGFVAQTLTNSIIEANLGPQGPTIDVVLLTSILALVVGALMGWYMLSPEVYGRPRGPLPEAPARPRSAAAGSMPLDGVDW
jgi:hypothetical protein